MRTIIYTFVLSLVRLLQFASVNVRWNASQTNRSLVCISLSIVGLTLNEFNDFWLPRGLSLTRKLRIFLSCVVSNCTECEWNEFRIRKYVRNLSGIRSDLNLIQKSSIFTRPDDGSRPLMNWSLFIFYLFPKYFRGCAVPPHSCTSRCLICQRENCDYAEGVEKRRTEPKKAASNEM